LGVVNYSLTDKERSSRVFRKSLFVVQDVAAGEEFSERNVRSIRPGYGLHSRHLEEILGRKAAKDILLGTPFSWDLVR
jgi:pseudaminic acid synthase